MAQRKCARTTTENEVIMYKYENAKKELPSRKRMVRYLTTWLIMHGKEYIGQEQALALDDLIGDGDEECWSYALDEGLVYNAGYSHYKVSGNKSKLTKKAIQYINHGLQKEKRK